MKPFLKISILIICTSLISCQEKSNIDLEKETRAILEIEAKSREYHFAKNAKALVDSFSKDFLSINKGIIDKPTYEKSFQKFNGYFKSVEFIKWDDKQEPIIRFSDDASIAYVAVEKLVIVEWKNQAGEKTIDTTNFAWLSVYKKTNGKWALDCIASTNK